MEREIDLLVAGDLNADIVLSGVDWPRIGAEHLAEAGSVALGGSAAICAANAALLGLRVRLAATVGADPLGAMLLDMLQKAGVDTSAVRVVRDAGTGFTVVINARGKREKALLTWPGALSQLRANDVRPHLKQARHLHCASYYLMSEMQAGLPALLRAARKQNVTTSVDPNPDPTGRYDSGIAAVLAEADLFFPNRQEAQRIAAAHGGGPLFRRLPMLARTTVLKNGGDGVVYLGSGVEIRHPAPGVKVIDPTGAGDSFEAGFLAARLRNADLHDALRFGQDCAAATCSLPGGTTALETPAIRARLRKQLATIVQSERR